MGVDLRMLPIECEMQSNTFSHTILSCCRRRELWSAINKLPQLPVPEPFFTYLGNSEDGERCYGDTKTTPYGEKIKYTTVEELLKVKDHEGVRDNYTNRAIWAYLTELPQLTKIALFWH